MKAFFILGISIILLNSAYALNQQFSRNISTFDSLSNHRNSCKISINEQTAVYCTDGYVGIIDSEKLFSLKDNVATSADISLNLNKSINDVYTTNTATIATNDTVIIIESDVTRKFNLSQLVGRSIQNYANLTIVSAKYGDPLLAVLLAQNNDSYLLTYKLGENSTDISMISNVSSGVVSYAIYDDTDRQSVYSMQNLQENSFKLTQYKIDSQAVLENPRITQLTACGTYMQVTQYFLVISCPSFNNNQGKIYVYLRSTLQSLFEVSGITQGAYFGSQLQAIESADGFQLQIFSIKFKQYFSLSSFEIIYNPELDFSDQYYNIDTYYFSKNLNSTEISLSAGYDYLMYHFNNSDTLNGFLVCDYQTYPKDSKCVPCEQGKYQVGGKCYSCTSKDQVDSLYLNKFTYICYIQSSTSYNPFILIFAVFGGVLLSLLICICLIILRIKGIICRSRYLRDQLRQNQYRETQLDQIKEHALKKLDQTFPNLKFKNTINKENQTSCCVCFEDYTPESEVKETICQHIFHSKCLIEWIKTKFDKPDCPTCRQEFFKPIPQNQQ